MFRNFSVTSIQIESIFSLKKHFANDIVYIMATFAGASILNHLIKLFKIEKNCVCSLKF